MSSLKASEWMQRMNNIEQTLFHEALYNICVEKRPREHSRNQNQISSANKERLSPASRKIRKACTHKKSGYIGICFLLREPPQAPSCSRGERENPQRAPARHLVQRVCSAGWRNTKVGKSRPRRPQIESKSSGWKRPPHPPCASS